MDRESIVAIKFEVDELYRIKFYDHAIGMSEAMECEVVGWVLESNELNVVVTFWKLNNGCEETKKDNVEPVSIMKSCIIKKRKLKKDL